MVTLVFAMVAIGVPALVWVAGFTEKRTLAQSTAEVTADSVSRLVATTPRHSAYLVEIIEDILRGRPKVSGGISYRVELNYGRAVAQFGDDPDWPRLTVRESVTDGIDEVGILEVRVGLLPEVLTVLLILGIGILICVFLALLARFVLLRFVDTVNRELAGQEAMKAVGQLTAGVAHDFNNLLGIIVGNLNLLTRNLPPESRDRTLAMGAIEAAERGAGLTHRLLAFSRQQALAARPTDVNELVRRMVGLLGRTLGESIAIRAVASDPPPQCMVDPEQLEAALFDLAINARDAMPQGGTLTIEIDTMHVAADRPAGLAELVPGGYAVIAVSDTGVGMAPEALARCFDPFFTTKEVGKGSGLGLSMVYGFVTQSNGAVKVYSDVGRGTTCKLYLPLATGEVAVERSAEAVPDAPGNGALSAEAQAVSSRESARRSPRIVVVDDEPSQAKLLEVILAGEGYVVERFTDSVLALARLTQHPQTVDLVVTDQIMPRVLGTMLAEQVTSLRRDLPVLLCTGYAAEHLDDHELPQGISAVLRKPYKPEQLTERVRQLLAP